jgi:hypothetical protein
MPWTASVNPQIQAKWRCRIAGHQTSSLNQSDFARENGFSLTSFYLWKKWLKENQALPAFVEVQTSKAIPCPSKPTIKVGDAFPAMILETQTRHRIHLHPDFDGPALSRLLCILAWPQPVTISGHTRDTTGTQQSLY